MELLILSPTKKETLHISWIEFNTPMGNYVIQPGHTPMILSLSPQSPITFRLQSGGTETLQGTVHGMAHIQRQSVTLLLSE